MDYFVTLRIPLNVLCILNACRLYLQVVTVSDICSADGKYILPEINAGNPIMHRHSNLAWPIQDRPQPADWRIWRHHLAYLEDKGQLITPLGRWTAKSHQQWHSYYNSEMKILYVKDADGNTNIFTQLSGPMSLSPEPQSGQFTICWNHSDGCTLRTYRHSQPLFN